MVIERMRDIARGRSVYTSDGEKLGTVKDVHLSAFKVDTSLQPDYWLPMRCVVSVGDDGLRLGFKKNSLDEFKLDDAAGDAE